MIYIYIYIEEIINLNPIQLEIYIKFQPNLTQPTNTWKTTRGVELGLVSFIGLAGWMHT